jgi:hypothetical protein
VFLNIISLSQLDSLISLSDTFPRFRTDIQKKASLCIKRIVASTRFTLKTETDGEGGRGTEKVHIGLSDQVEHEGIVYLEWTRKANTASAPFQFYDITAFYVYMREKSTDKEPGALYQSKRRVKPR